MPVQQPGGRGRPSPGRGGRRDESRLMVEQVFTDVAAGRAGVLLVDGEAGIGRTTFLHEAAELARSMGFQVAWGRCHPQEKDLPLGLVRQAFDSLHIGDIASELPWLAEGLEGAHVSSPALLGALIELYRTLQQMTSRSPLLVVVDDLQWCDEASLRALGRFTHEGAPPFPLAVVAAVRTDEVAAHPAAFEDATAHLPRTRLTGLSSGEVEAMVRDVFPEEPHPDFVDTCRRVTAGNPTLLRALLQELVHQGVSPSDATTSVLAHAPESTARDVLARIDRLGPDAATLAKAVALLGDGAELDRAARVAGLPYDQASVAVDALCGAGVLSNDYRLTFRHAVVGSALARFLPVGTVTMLRRRDAQGEQPTTAAPPARPAHRRPAAGSPARTGPSLEIRCLGGFSVRRAGIELDLAQLRPKARKLLRLLALHVGTAVHRDQLLDELWPGLPPEQGVRNLQVTVSRLRAFLEPGADRGASRLVLRRAEAYQLVLDDGAVWDIGEFERARGVWRRARLSTDADEQAKLLRTCLRWYQGDLLPEDGAAEWVVVERARLRNQAAELSQVLGELELELKHFDSAVRAARRSLALDPFRDVSWRVLISAYRLAGDAAAASRVKREYAQMLHSLGSGSDEPGRRRPGADRGLRSPQ
ncbi:AAA family ATPase [Streptomyces sp. NPDC054770]